MAKLRLPERLRDNLIALSAVSDAEADELYRHLAEMPPTLMSDEVADALSEKLTGWKKETVLRVIPGLVSLCLYRAGEGKAPEEFTSEVIEALKNPPPPGPKDSPRSPLPPDSEQILRSRILKFLKLNAFDVSAKAIGVMSDHERVFIGSRVLSDIRPVFRDDISVGPAAAVIVHMLKIEYVTHDVREEVFVALDGQDVGSLLDVLTRAKQKEETLRKLLAASSLPILESR